VVSQLHMHKVIHSDKNITVFGGLNFIFKAISDKKLDRYLDKRIGYRNPGARYTHSDIILSLLGSSLVQGSFIADLAVLKAKYRDQFFSKIPSADTVEYVCQQLKTDTIRETTANGATHHLNFSTQMNATLIGLAMQTGALKVGNQGYVMDFDHMIVETDKQDALRTYKRTKGYHPNLAFIGRIPIHLENHNGNTPAKYGQMETLQRCFGNLNDAGVSISAFRGDSASYQKEVVNVVEQHTNAFYIRISGCESFRKKCGTVKQWKTVIINDEVKQVASIAYMPFRRAKKSYRAVIIRSLRKDKQIDMLSETPYDYHGLLTNDKSQDEKAVIEFYNARGDAENSNRYMLGDFNLHHLPFPDMCTNTVFMYIMAMCATLFEWIKQILVLNKVKIIATSMRVKAVCFHYITVASSYINHARKKTLKVFAPANTYHELLI